MFYPRLRILLLVVLWAAASCGAGSEKRDLQSRDRMDAGSGMGTVHDSPRAGESSNPRDGQSVPINSGGVSGGVGGGAAGAGGRGGGVADAGGARPGSVGMPDAGAVRDASVDAQSNASLDARSVDGRGAMGDGRKGGDTSGALFKVTVGDVNSNGARLCFKAEQTAETNNSPPVSWAGSPPLTRSFAIVLRDTVNGNTHWIMWNISADVTMMAALLPKGTMPGAPAPVGSVQRGSSFAGGMTNPGYFGPGADFRRYDFELYALKVDKLIVGANTTVNDLRIQLMTTADRLATAVQPVWGSRGGTACPAP